MPVPCLLSVWMSLTCSLSRCVLLSGEFCVSEAVSSSYLGLQNGQSEMLFLPAWSSDRGESIVTVLELIRVWLMPRH